jgi:hypothetical protein
VETRNTLGRTPLQVAEALNRHEAAELLRAVGLQPTDDESRALPETGENTQSGLQPPPAIEHAWMAG